MLSALVFVTALVAQHYHPRPIHTQAEAIVAFYEQWREFVPQSQSLESWQKQLTGKRVGKQWLLHRGGGDALDIQLDAATGRVGSVIVID
jgi:hypothetical protein